MAVRLLGGLLILASVLLLLVVALIAIFDLPRLVLTIAVVGVAAIVVGVGVFAGRRPVMVRLDETGYQLSLLPKAGVQRARWSDVEDVVTGFAPLPDGSSQAVVVIRLAAGQTTTIPVNLIQGSADDFARDIQARLRH